MWCCVLEGCRDCGSVFWITRVGVCQEVGMGDVCESGLDWRLG